MSSKLKRILGILIGVLLVLALAAILFGVFTVRRSFPQTSGEITLAGLEGPVDIYRDDLGIPHIYAESHHDLFFAQSSRYPSGQVISAS